MSGQFSDNYPLKACQKNGMDWILIKCIRNIAHYGFWKLYGVNVLDGWSGYAGIIPLRQMLGHRVAKNSQ